MYKITVRINGSIFQRVVSCLIDAQDILTGILFGGISVVDVIDVIHYAPSETLNIRIEPCEEKATEDFRRA